MSPQVGSAVYIFTLNFVTVSVTKIICLLHQEPTVGVHTEQDSAKSVKTSPNKEVYTNTILVLVHTPGFHPLTTLPVSD